MRCATRAYLALVVISVLLMTSVVIYIKDSGHYVREYSVEEAQAQLQQRIRQRQKYFEDRTLTSSPPAHNLTSSLPAHPSTLLLKDVVGDLHTLMDQLSGFQRRTRSTETKYQLRGPLSQVHKLLIKLTSTVEVRNDNNITQNISKTEKVAYDVCPEKFASKDLSGGYPFFYKGFDMLNCTDAPKLSKIVTIVFNIVKMKMENKINIVSKMLQGIYSAHGNMKVVVAATPKDINQIVANISPGVVSFLEFDERDADSDIWNAAVLNVTTKYVLIARNVVHFTWHSRLERLVRELTLLKAAVIAGSSRFMSGLWNHGCEQSKLQNFTLAYRKGYDWSQHECMMCDTVQGPFMTTTKFFVDNLLPVKMSDVSGFEVWFLNLKKKDRLVASCPDSMFFVEDHSRAERELWTDLVAHIQVERLRLSSSVEHRFSCSEAGVGCEFAKDKALSHCCINQLSGMVKTFLKLCKESGSLCELQEGTLLGAVKFNGILPWERDADLTFHTANFSSILALEPKLSAAGYSLSKGKDPWCCVDGVPAGGTFVLNSKNWHAELYGQHLMDSEKLLKDKIAPTVIELDGQLVATPTSPGLFSRNRYGFEIYQHAPHWMTDSHASGWAFYNPGDFTKCQTPGHHTCLDQYLADGNLHFQSPDP